MVSKSYVNESTDCTPERQPERAWRPSPRKNLHTTAQVSGDLRGIA